MSFKVVEITASAENTFTDGVSPTQGHAEDFLNISILGSSGWDAIVTLQRKFPNTSWRDTDTFNNDFEGSICDSEEGVLYRLGVKEGDYTSGDIELRLSK